MRQIYNTPFSPADFFHIFHFGNYHKLYHLYSETEGTTTLICYQQYIKDTQTTLICYQQYI